MVVMPPSSSSLQAARQRLGGKLRELRLAAELTGRSFAAAAGCQASKVSQIEKGVRPASVSADFHAANRASWLAELEAEAAVLPPGDGGVGAQVGLAQDG